MFDPYHRWLAIPRGDRPPTYYQLLGIAPDEADPDVIAEAALRQTSHVRTYQTGPHANLCTALLNEIAQARTTLLRPDRRRDYDARLGAPTGARQSQEQPRRLDEGPAVGDGLSPSPFFFDDQANEAGERCTSAPRPAARDASGTGPAALAYVVLLLLGAGLAFWLGARSQRDTGAPPTGAAGTTRAPKVKPAPLRAPASRERKGASG